MHDHLLEMTSRSLVKLEDYASRIDDLLTPTQAASGTNSGKPPSRRGSRPPIVMGVLDMKRDVETTLGRWCAAVREYHPTLAATPAVGIAARAKFLRSHLLDWELAPWAELAAEQIISATRFVSDVIEPPESASAPAPVEVGTAREIARWCQHLGVPVARSTIQSWIRDGRLEAERLPDGRVLVRLEDVIERAGANY